jgi:hypothetical protein
MSKAAAASTIPQTNTTRQENTGKSVIIFVILAPAVTHLDDPARSLARRGNSLMASQLSLCAASLDYLVSAGEQRQFNPRRPLFEQQ